MSGQWQTVRVFISSTFRDMHAERDHLVKVVFPALRERLETYRVHLIDIDLRWGVTREQAENAQALALCLQQVDECRPFFLGLLGERHGWVPDAFPTDLLARHGWVKHHAGKSVTDLEMLYGVVAARDASRRAFFYFRNSAALDSIPDDRRADFVESDPEQVRKLRALKDRIRRHGYPLFDGYPARWDAGAYDRPSRSHGRLDGLEEFGRRVQADLWQAIQAELKLPVTPPTETVTDPLAEEQDYHDRFMESRLRVYVGRDEVLSLSRVSSRRPLLSRDECRNYLLNHGLPMSGRPVAPVTLPEHGADPGLEVAVTRPLRFPCRVRGVAGL
jgi:hypothetical protein